MIETFGPKRGALRPEHTRALLQEYAEARTAHGAESPAAVAIRNRIVEGNLGLVFHLAKRAGRIPHDEALGIGAQGLIKAVERFDLAHATQFSTYATWWIRHAFSRTADNEGDLIRIPTHARGAKSRGASACAEAANAARRVTSLDAPLGDHGAETFGARTEDPKALAAFEALDAQQETDALRAALAELPERLRFVLEQRALGLTLPEVGRQLGLARERVRQLEAEGLGRLRRTLRVREAA